MTDKDDIDRHNTGECKAEAEVNVSTVFNDRRDSRSSVKRSRSVVPDKRSTSKHSSRSDSRDNQETNYRSSCTNDNKRQKQENLSQIFFRTLRITEEFIKSLISQLVCSHIKIKFIHILVVVTTTKSL